jgi:hypothetical protein
LGKFSIFDTHSQLKLKAVVNNPISLNVSVNPKISFSLLKPRLEREGITINNTHHIDNQHTLEVYDDKRLRDRSLLKIIKSTKEGDFEELVARSFRKFKFLCGASSINEQIYYMLGNYVVDDRVSDKKSFILLLKLGKSSDLKLYGQENFEMKIVELDYKISCKNAHVKKFYKNGGELRFKGVYELGFIKKSILDQKEMLFRMPITSNVRCSLVHSR